MLKNMILIILGIFVFVSRLQANDSCDEICKALKNVSSPYSDINLNYIVNEKKLLYEKLISDYGYTEDEAIKIVKFQPNNLGFHWRDGIVISALGVKDLYLNSIVDGWTVSKATFLQLHLLKEMNLKKFMKLSQTIDDFSLIVKGVVSADASLQMQGKTQKFIESFDNIIKNHVFTYDDMNNILDYADNVVKIFSIDSKKVNILKGLSDLKSSENKLHDYAVFKKYINRKDSRIKLLTSKDLLFMNTYYKIVRYKGTLQAINLIAAIFSGLEAKLKLNIFYLEDALKSTGIAYKFASGLAGTEPTFNQNFSSYATNSIAIYKQNPNIIIETYSGLKRDLQHLISSYVEGEKLSKNQVNQFVNLWNKYEKNTDFSNFVIQRYLKQRKKVILEKILCTNVQNKTKVNLPLIGELYNVVPDEINNLTLQIWGKNGNIVNKKLSDYDVSTGSYNNYLIAEIGGKYNGIKIKVDTDDAFYDKDGNFYYYKYGIFDKNMNMIYSFINQENGGYAPGWDYTEKNNKIMIKEDTDISINNAFGIIPFYINDTETNMHKKFVQYKKITHRSNRDIDNKNNSLIKYITALNKYNNIELSKKLSRVFGIDFNYVKTKILNKEKYTVKDVLDIDFKILTYINNHTKNEEYRKKIDIILNRINQLLKNKYYLEKYGYEKILYKIFKMNKIVDINKEELDKKLSYGIFSDEMIKLYKFIKGNSK